MLIDLEYEFGTIVYLKTDPDQFPRIITGAQVHPGNYVVYQLSKGTDTTWALPIEFTVTRDTLTVLR